MAQYGVSATYLLKQRLLAEIKNELLFTSKSISEIAYAFSFPESSHLMRFFKQQTGKTCRKFQEDYKNGVYEWEWLIILIDPQSQEAANHLHYGRLHFELFNFELLLSGKQPSILILLSQLTYKIELICIHGVLNEGCFGDPLCLTADPRQRHYRLRYLPILRLFPSNFCRDTWILPPLMCAPSIGKSIGRVADACPWTLAIAKVARIRCLFRGVA